MNIRFTQIFEPTLHAMCTAGLRMRPSGFEADKFIIQSGYENVGGLHCAKFPS